MQKGPVMSATYLGQRRSQINMFLFTEQLQLLLRFLSISPHTHLPNSNSHGQWESPSIFTFTYANTRNFLASSSFQNLQYAGGTVPGSRRLMYCTCGKRGIGVVILPLKAWLVPVLIGSPSRQRPLNFLNVW